MRETHKVEQLQRKADGRGPEGGRSRIGGAAGRTYSDRID